MKKLIDRIQQLIENDPKVKTFLAKKLNISEYQLRILNNNPNKKCEEWELIQLETKGTFEERLPILNKKILEIREFDNRTKNALNRDNRGLYIFFWELTILGRYNLRGIRGLEKESLKLIVEYFRENGFDFNTSYTEAELSKLNK